MDEAWELKWYKQLEVQPWAHYEPVRQPAHWTQWQENRANPAHHGHRQGPTVCTRCEKQISPLEDPAHTAHCVSLTLVTEPLPHSWAEGISLHTKILMSASFITWAGDLQPFEKTTNPAHDYLWFREKGEKIKIKRKNPSVMEHIVTVLV